MRFEFFTGLFTRTRDIDCQFNPEMSNEHRNATLLDRHRTDRIGVRVSPPEVLVSCCKRHLLEIARQARLCGYEPEWIEMVDRAAVYSMFPLHAEMRKANGQ